MLWSATRHKFLNDTQTNIVCWWFASALDKYNASQVKWTKPIYHMNTLNTTVTVSHCARSRQIVPSKWQPLVFMRCLCSQVMMRPRRRKSCSSSKSTQPGDDETLVGWCVCSGLLAIGDKYSYGSLSLTTNKWKIRSLYTTRWFPQDSASAFNDLMISLASRFKSQYFG